MSHAEKYFSFLLVISVISASFYKSRELFGKRKYTVFFAFAFSLKVKVEAKYEILFLLMKLSLQKRIRR